MNYESYIVSRGGGMFTIHIATSYHEDVYVGNLNMPFWLPLDLNPN